MKILNRVVSIVIIVATCLLSLSIYCFAEAYSDATSAGVVTSDTIAEPEIQIESLIRETVTKEVIDERYKMFSVDKPEVFTFDTSIYLLEYNVSTDYWSTVATMDYKGMTTAIDPDYPTIYIPLFADIADSEGNMQTRVIGHIKLAYSWTDSDYSLGMSLYNLADDDYKDKKNVWFYEQITDYLVQSKKSALQVFLIRYPSSLTDGHEKIAVIQTTNDTVILDVSNSLNVSSLDKQTGLAPAYTISEYSAQRILVEKDLYQATNGWDKNPAGGNVGLISNDGTYLLYILVAAITAGVVGFLLIIKHRKHVSKC